MKVLILGSGGFIGSSIVKELIADDNNDIIAYQRRMPQPNELKKNIRYIVDDLANIEKHFEIIAEAEVIIHAVSSLLPVSDSFNSEIVNVISPTVALLDRFKNTNKHFIFISSGGSVYKEKPQSNRPLSEDDEQDVYNFYGLSKKQLEDIFIFYRNRYSLAVTILRPSNVFGFRTHNIGVNGIISTLISNAASGMPTTIWGPGTAIRDYIFINDFTKALCKIAGIRLEGVYNISSGNAKSVNEIINLVDKYSPNKCIIKYKNDNYHFPEYIVLDNTKIKNDLPLDKQSDFEEQIEELVRKYYANKKLIQY